MVFKADPAKGQGDPGEALFVLYCYAHAHCDVCICYSFCACCRDCNEVQPEFVPLLEKRDQSKGGHLL